MDDASSTGAWTTKTLELIAAHPGVVSAQLAKRMKMERPAFKVNVRKLKELGLTESLEIGYRLSPLGQALMRLRAVQRPG
jgi:predicted transcriptional regulator